MFSRTVRNPLVSALGAGTILLIGSGAVAFAAPTPSPSPSASADPTLSVTLALSDATAHAGESVTATVTVAAANGTAADVSVNLLADPASSMEGVSGSAGATCNASACALGEVSDANETVTGKVTIPASMSRGTVQVQATADGSNTEPVTKAAAINVEPKATPTPTRTPTPRPTKTITATPTPSDPGANNSEGNSSPDNGTGGGGAGTSLGGGGTSGGGFVPTNPGNLTVPGGTNAAEGPLLPQIAPGETAPDPATAAQQQTGNTSALRGESPAPHELTFSRLASTQAAWLAVLLVAFSLLLTQVKLGRAPVREASKKGAHRRR